MVLDIETLHLRHYQSCNCLGDSHICCVPSCPCKDGIVTTKQRSLIDALEEIRRLRSILGQITEVSDKKYISNGKKVDQITRMARMALSDGSD